MPPSEATESPTDLPYTKCAGAEPIPGYVLLEPLGRGGFGEVWKCEAPGGLHKAVKFVGGGGNDEVLLRQEFEAFQQVKTIRHPFLLCLERVELVGGELVMVMGLADKHIGDRFQECEAAGLPGIPRNELLGYMIEAAEALDVIGERYGLQHLDVKPANLFLTAGHVQVGDYGLVSKLSRGDGTVSGGGLTPRYAAPEVLRGEVHTRSDQYSLALVYQELLTGTFPFSGRTWPQIMMQHATAAPDLSGLPESDRDPIAIALAKAPEDRFPSCRGLVDALCAVTAGSRIMPMPQAAWPTPAPVGTPAPVRPAPRGPSGASETARNATATTQTPKLPRLVTATPRSAERAPVPPPPPPVAPASPQVIAPPSPTGVHLPFILSVVAVEWLRGRDAPDPVQNPDDMIRAVTTAAGAGATKPLPDSPWTRRFQTTIDPRVARVKLGVLWEPNSPLVMTEDEGRVKFLQAGPTPPPSSGLFSGFAKKASLPVPSWLEVVIELPKSGAAIAEVVATGRIGGSPTPEFARTAADTITKLLDGAQRILGNFREQRKHPRFAARFPVTITPIYSDGRVEPPVSGHTRDVSAGGLAIEVTAPLTSRHAFVAFSGVPGTERAAILLEIVRTADRDGGVLVGGRWRTDLWPE